MEKHITNEIRERRKFTFDGRRITPHVVRRLAKVVNEEAHSENTSAIFSVDASDNSSYESLSVAIFDEQVILEKKMIQKVNMQLNSEDHSKNIQIQIIQSVETNPENFIIVSGDDTTWVNGILGRLIEMITSCEEQPQFMKWSGWALFLLWIAFIVLYYRLFIKDATAKSEWMGYLIIGIPLVSIALIFPLHNYIKSLWPSVELQTGPHYLRLPEQKRRKVIWIFTSIILPLILAAIYDFLKRG